MSLLLLFDRFLLFCMFFFLWCPTVCVRIENSYVWDTGTDLDALITVEVLFVTPMDDTEETVQVANIQFNNLDIIGELRHATFSIYDTEINCPLQPIRRRSSS